MPPLTHIQSSGSDEENHTLIDALLAEQSSLTAVAQFARRHDNHAIPADTRFYRDLIPTSAPQAGQQYGFEVDLDKCSGCKACVAACHNLNGLDDNETWRSVGSLFGGNAVAPLQLTVTTACHHCIDPACLNGCPVVAYEKDANTGIVSHIADRCIGCQYCTLKCPYEVPQFSERRGIVRKCDMCSSRLAQGQAPACVQACPSEAIRIAIVDKQQITETTTTGAQLVAGAPDSAYTLPTTRYNTTRELPPNTAPADATMIRPQKSHPSLVFMLVLTQISVGMYCVGTLHNVGAAQNIVALLFGFAGLAASVFHLGQPFRAWRALANLRRSWLSREIAAFSLFAGLAVAASIASWFRWQHATSILLASVSLVGLFSVLCSAMIYVDTQRTLWHFRSTVAKFLGTTALLGLSGVLATFTVLQKPFSLMLPVAVIFASLLKLSFEASFLLPSQQARSNDHRKSAQLLFGVLKTATLARFACGIIGGIIFPLIISSLHTESATIAVAAFIICLTGEFLERHLFFKAAVAPKMPGGVSA